MPHRFNFFRAGGVDQVSIQDGDDLLALNELDQKLWVALAMPTKGVAIDPVTLALLDDDSDGRIRVRDILAAINWAKVTFVKPADVLKSKDAIELTAIADEKVVAAAKRVLGDLGKKDEKKISIADVTAVEKAFADTVLNGDGVVVPGSTDEADLKKLIEDAIASVGSVPDRSTKPGIDKAHADAFFAEVDKRAGWLARGSAELLQPLGANTATAAAAAAAVRAKIDDYFTRSSVAAYDPRGAATMNSTPEELSAMAKNALTTSDEALGKLPLSQIDAVGRLPLTTGLNPAWAAKIETFVKDAVAPILGARTHLTIGDHGEITTRLAPYQAWMDEKPVTKVDALEGAWVEKLATSDLRKQLDALIAKDAALADDYNTIHAVSKAVHMQRDFGRVLRNFVNFSDFYSKQDGVFQAGTLYFDARALHLCVPVIDAAKHAALAGSSASHLIYCDITRKGETKQIAVAITNGDVDNVFVGRNGVFYDRDGNDWDATVAKIIPNPISVRAAFWSPYKRLVKTIEDNVQKRAQAAEAASLAKVDEAGAHVAEVDKKEVEAASAAPAATPPPAAAVAVAAAPAEAPSAAGKIDLGTIAAIGVAIGGIGTLFGALLATLFGLGPWLPIGVLAMLLMISGPSMLLAWLKLRRRNLGPILDANGWAINSRAKINVPFGAAMTELPKLPEGAKRSLDDPFAEKRTPWRRWVVLVVILGLGGLWYLGKLDDYLPSSVTSVSVLGENCPAGKAIKKQKDAEEAARKAEEAKQKAEDAKKAAEEAKKTADESKKADADAKAKAEEAKKAADKAKADAEAAAKKAAGPAAPASP